MTSTVVRFERYDHKWSKFNDRNSYCDFNHIGVRTFILYGAPLSQISSADPQLPDCKFAIHGALRLTDDHRSNCYKREHGNAAEDPKHSLGPLETPEKQGKIFGRHVLDAWRREAARRRNSGHVF